MLLPNFADFSFLNFSRLSGTMILLYSFPSDDLSFPLSAWIYLFVLTSTHPLSLTHCSLSWNCVIHATSPVLPLPEDCKYLYLIPPRLRDSIHLWNPKEGVTYKCDHIIYNQTGIIWESKVNAIHNYSKVSGENQDHLGQTGMHDPHTYEQSYFWKFTLKTQYKSFPHHCLSFGTLQIVSFYKKCWLVWFLHAQISFMWWNGNWLNAPNICSRKMQVIVSTTENPKAL